VDRHADSLQQVAAGLKALERVKTPLIDRATLEKLLRVYLRVAIRLMHRFGGYQAGPDVPDRPRLARAAVREGRRRRSVFLRKHAPRAPGGPARGNQPRPGPAAPNVAYPNFPAFLPRSGLDPVSWRLPASTRRTCSANSRAGQWRYACVVDRKEESI
jgi:hypothetical protein